MSVTIISKDPLRAAVEGASGGRQTVLYDANGIPQYMTVIPKMRIEDIYPGVGLTGTHPAYIVNGVEKSEILIGTYMASKQGNYCASLPNMDPYVNINFDEALALCRLMGPNWHLMTNAEWAALQGLALVADFQPRGNTYWGQHHELKHETGVLTPGNSGLGVKNDSLHGRTYTGSGPQSWRHDNTPFGAADLVGNSWEWVGGMRINAGEIQVIKDNDAALSSCNMTASSTEWKAMLQNGTLVTPGTANTLKYDAVGANGTGAVTINTVVSSALTDESNGAGVNYRDMQAKSGVTVPALAKILGLYPSDTSKPLGYFYLRNSNERLPIRGGDYADAGTAGLFALSLYDRRTTRNRYVGFRPAFFS